MKKRLSLLLILFPLFALAQIDVKGIVKDAITEEPLPFASVITNTQKGVMSDVDGRFLFTVKNSFETLNISYIGYKDKQIQFTGQKNIVVLLQPSEENLKEVVINAKGVNPAHKIIKNVINSKKLNAPEKALNTYQAKAYSKLLVTANPDSISSKIDSVFVEKDGVKTFKKLDSTNYNFKKEVTKHHLYILEKIAEHRYKKGLKPKEKILATRMAGFKNPIYEALAVNLQDMSFYKNTYSILGTNYINPVAKNAFDHYNYKILDTVANTQGKSYMIYYKPKKASELIAMEGLLYIDTETYAITKAIAELRASVYIKATQDFEYFPSEKIWFPKKTSVLAKKGETKGRTGLFGGTVVLDNTKSKPKDSLKPRNKNNASNQVYFIKNTEFFDVKFNEYFKLKNGAQTVEVNEDANKKSAKFWNQYRKDTLSKRGENAYVYLDSIMKKERVEEKIKLGRSLITGYFPTKYVDINLSKLIKVNNYEGLRIGFGGKSNETLSKNFQLEGYVAYGTKDKDFKYSIGAAKQLNKAANTWLKVYHTDDIKEAGALDFLIHKKGFSISNPRNLNLFDFYNYKTFNVGLYHDIKANLESVVELSSGRYSPTFGYTNTLLDPTATSYKLTTATVGFHYSPFNEYMYSPLGKTKKVNKYPQFHLQVEKSFKNVFNGDFNFTKLNLRTEYNIYRPLKATTKILLQGGLVFGDAPITHLYNATPNYTYHNPWIRRVAFAGKNSFETMGYNEFISDKYAMLQVKHQVKGFGIGKWKPETYIVTRVAYGDFKNPQQHLGFNFQKMNKGYYESGFELNKIFAGFGLGAFYRYGSYAKSEWSDNLAVKLSYHFKLGF